jgi:plasmid replication initiation protein
VNTRRPGTFKIKLVRNGVKMYMYVGRNGAGYFAVTISQVLKPYLLQVKREFFRFRLFHVMQLRSSYAIRLYQWGKRWEFRKYLEISVQELRNVVKFQQRYQTRHGHFAYPL